MATCCAVERANKVLDDANTYLSHEPAGVFITRAYYLAAGVKKRDEQPARPAGTFWELIPRRAAGCCCRRAQPYGYLARSCSYVHT